VSEKICKKSLRQAQLCQFLESDLDQGRVGKLSMRRILLRSAFFDFRDWHLCARENLVLWRSSGLQESFDKIGNKRKFTVILLENIEFLFTSISYVRVSIPSLSTSLSPLLLASRGFSTSQWTCLIKGFAVMYGLMGVKSL